MDMTIAPTAGRRWMEVKIVRLVDLDAVIDQLEIELGYEGMREDLYSLPVVDAAPVVRCKDCRYLGRELDKGLYSCDDYNLPYCEPDSYCSHGRRKEETKHAAD